MEREITCPSGLQGTIRSLKMRDVQAISQITSNKRGDFIKKVIDLGWVGVTSLGPYKDPFDWHAGLLGDAFYVFVQIRTLTYGDKYVCDTVCPRCQKAEPQTIDLGELEVLPLPEASKERFTSNRPFAVDINGTKVAFKLLTLKDERGVGQLMETRQLSYTLATLVQRTLQLNDKTVIPGESVKFYSDLDGGDVSDLDRFVDGLECGLDTNIACVCGCGTRYTQKLPLADRFFSTVSEPGKEPRFTLTG